MFSQPTRHKPLSKHSLSCDCTLPCKLLKLFNKNPWTKSKLGDFQFGILPRIFFKLSFVVSNFSYFVTLTLCKSSNHFASLSRSTDSLQSLPKSFLVLQRLADHHHIFLLPDLIPNKTTSDHSETFCFV